MSEFRFQNKPKPKQSNTDGFITPRQPSSDNLRVRFRQNYSPAQFESARPRRPVQSEFLSKEIKTSQETFHLNKTDFSKQVSADQNLDLRLDEELPKSAKRRWFGLRKAKSQKPKRSVGKRVARGFAVFFFVLLLGASSIFGYAFLKQRQIFNGSGDGAAALGKNVTPSQLNGEGDGRVNILLVGKGGPGHEAPDLTDTLLLASIDPVQNEAAMVSVPRDLYVQDANGYSTKINAVYSNAKQARLSQATQQNDTESQAAEDAGLSALKQKVSEVLGVPVHYYVMVDFTAFKEAIDTVGGITIDVKEQLYDQTMAWMNGGNPLIADVGMQTFDGNRALMYARSRHGSARGDFDRSERQKEVIFALQQKVLTLGTFSNPVKIVELINTLGNNVRTDFSGLSELSRLYEIGKQITHDKFVSVSLADPEHLLVTTDFIDNQSVVVPIAGQNQYEEIHSYIRNTLKDAFLKNENARVVILNGSETPGLASYREKELKSYGYNIVQIDNAPTSDYIQTRLIDLTGGTKPFTASYLEKRFGLTKEATAIAGLPTAETADFVIILGSNEATAQASSN